MFFDALVTRMITLSSMAESCVPSETYQSRGCLQGVMGALDTSEPGQERLFNLGNTHPHTVSDLVSGLETVLGKTAVRHYVDLPNLGDVLQTHSNISAAQAAFNYSPQV